MDNNNQRFRSRIAAATTSPRPCPMENVSTTFQSLDTVRALHQTVVSLRSALEEAKFEIQKLRTQITTEEDIKKGAKAKAKAKAKTNNTNRESQKTLRFVTKTNQQQQQQHPEKPKQATQPQPNNPNESVNIENNNQYSADRNIVIEDIEETEQTEQTEQTSPTTTSKPESNRLSARKSTVSILPDISIVSTPRYCCGSSNTDNKMASKIDVKIKVTSKINMASDGNQSCSVDPAAASLEVTDEDHTTDSSAALAADSNQNDFKYSTQENISVRKNKDGEYIMSQSSKENLHLDYENSQSESDSSVFEEPSDKIIPNVPKEECDDIELVFSSEGNHPREPIQEEMISLSEYDPWQAAGSSGTPVLVKFSSLQSDNDSTCNESNRSSVRQSKIPTSSTCDVFVRNFSNESSDSFDNKPILSLKSSSLCKENSDEQKEASNLMSRDESLDFFDNTDNGGSMGRKWTNYNVLVETDISKCGIAEESGFELYHRRNTCPNPPAYRPILSRDPHTITRHIPSRLASKYCRRVQYNPACNASSHYSNSNNVTTKGPKRSSSAQTEISALPDYWKSECQLAGNRYHIGGPCTLPSKFVPLQKKGGCQKQNSRVSERTQEARRVLLSDINFTSMVPELSRSADHLCQDENNSDEINKQQQVQASGYYKGNHLKTPDFALKGLTPSTSMTSPGVSQWTVNENSFGTQTTQTVDSWGGKHGDSFDSCRSYSTGSRISGLDSRHHRSRSVPSVRCVICKQTRTPNSCTIRTSESMHYTPRVTFQEPASKIRGSLPDLRQDCMCSRRYTGRTIFTIQGDSSGSTESLLDEADVFVRKSLDGVNSHGKRPNLRRMSENDIQRDYIPSKQSLPFLPKTAKCLKTGHLAKVITKSGRVVVGRVRYVGPLVTMKTTNKECQLLASDNYINNHDKHHCDDLYVGIQLQSKCGDCDGTFEGRKLFDCEPLQGLFVPFKKVIMAWSA